MKNYIGDFDDWQEALDTIHQAGMTDYNKFPEVYFAWNVAKKTNNYDLIDKLLTRNSWIYTMAKNKIKDCPFLPFPMGEEVQKIAGKFNLGYVNYHADWAGFEPLDLTRGLFICGEIGSGKTYPVLRLYDYILSIPFEQRGFNIIIIQVVKRDADFLINRHPDLRVIEWNNLRRNIFEIEPWDKIDTAIETVCSVFASTNYLMSMTQPILKIAVKRCFMKNGVFVGSNHYPTFSQILSEIDNAATQMELQGYEKKNVCDKLKIRLSEFKETGDILNCRHGYQINDFWSKEDICLNVMDEPNDYIYATVITELLINLQRYHEQNQTHPARLKTLIGIDECRSVFPVKKNHFDYDSDRFLEKWTTTARSSGIGRITITQEPQSVSSWLTNNCAFFLTFPIAGEAVDHLKKLQNLSDEQIAYIQKLPKYGTGIFRDRRFDRCYLIQVPGDLDIVEVTKTEVEDIMKPYIENIQAQLPNPEPVAASIREKSQSTGGINFQAFRKKTNVHHNAFDILDVLKEDPFVHYTALRDDRLKFTADKMKSASDWLISSGLITVVKCAGPSGKQANYLSLTEKAQDNLKISKANRISPSHFRHTLYCERIKNRLESKGHKAIREYAVLPGGSHTSDSGRIDVYAADINTAYEITLTLNKGDILKNVYKCFSHFRVDQLCIVCERQEPDLERVNLIITDNVPAGLLDKIEFRTIRNFL